MSKTRTGKNAGESSEKSPFTKRKRSGLANIFAHFSRVAAAVVGHPVAFALALSVVVVWAVSGPIFHYSEMWQLVINTGTSIATFLMVFVLQNAQNRDSRAIQIKLDELLLKNHDARNELIDLEDLTEEDLARYRDEFKRLHEHYAGALDKRKGG